MWCLGPVGTTGAIHRMMVVKRRRLRSGSGDHALLLAFRLEFSALRSGHDGICSAGIGWVIEKSSNVVHEKWVKHLRNLFLVGKI